MVYYTEDFVFTTVKRVKFRLSTFFFFNSKNKIKLEMWKFFFH